MHQIQIETFDSTVIKELQVLVEKDENIDMIQGRNFSGDLTSIEIYVPLIVSVIASITPIITAWIQKKQVSSIKIDGEKLELNNVSPKITEEVLRKYFENHQTEEEKDSRTKSDCSAKKND